MTKLHRSIQILLIFLLLVAALGASTKPIRTFGARLHPMLAQAALENPTQLVSVIVQKAETSQRAETHARQLGGQVTRELYIINAFAAEMPASAALELARSPDVRWVSPDAPMVEANCTGCINTANLASYYVQAIGADKLWNTAPYLQGQGMSVVVVDSGINTGHDDFDDAVGNTRVTVSVKFNSFTNNEQDKYGHGTHIGGIIAGNGYHSNGRYIGVAPKINVINIKVSDDQGKAATSDVVNGLQWILDNRQKHNIRIVNLSMNSAVAESYHTSPLDAALEILWFNGIVVVVSAGNNGSGMNNGVLYPPANDPFVITVGAVNDRGTISISDDTLAPYSAFGVTLDGHSKPDLLAPGSNIISLLPNPKGVLWKDYPANRVTDTGSVQHYFRMSGTSMASAVTAGAVALLLQDEPNLNPDQVKYRLMNTARQFNAGNGARYLDIYAAVNGSTTETANTGIAASQLLWTGSNPINWGSVNWGSVNWGSVNWGSVNWGSVNWGSVNWGSDYWGN